MTLGLWWLALAAVIGILTGITTCLVFAALIRTRPMDGRTYTGPLPRDLDIEEDETDEFLRDLNQQGHNG